jgi:hypothetical protein
MANARETFDSSIKDAEDLLGHFVAQPTPKPQNAEVLKRAGLVMALTAWETYVEDRALEELQRNPKVTDGSLPGSFMLAKLKEELKRFHTPDSNKTRKLFRDYTGIDVTAGWKWAGYDCAAAKKKLNELLGVRGEIVHRAKEPDAGGPPKAHPVKKEDLKKAIQFLKGLVTATEGALSGAIRKAEQLSC